MSLPDDGKKNNLSKITAIGAFALVLSGYLANFLQIFESRLIRSIPWDLALHITNFIVLIVIIILYRKNKGYEDSLKSEINRLETQRALDIELWQYFIDKLRSITIKRELNEKDALEPLLDILLKRLPEGGKHHNITIAKLTPDLRFKIIAKKHFKDQSANSIEQKAGWSGKEPLLFYSKIIEDKRKFRKYKSDEDNAGIQRPVGIKPSSSHFLIALKNEDYVGNLFSRKTLCVVSIGIPQEYDFKDEDSDPFYVNIYPTIKSIESMLLNISINNGVKN